jgi:DMSO/TMAO reductase YedYZ molybdopterin-dependent catalytic subunit
VSLPEGQRLIADFPRFGLPQRLVKQVSAPAEPVLRIGGEVAQACELTRADLASVPRRDQASDFHCVFTWSRLGVAWGGWALHDVYERLILPRARPRGPVRYLQFHAADGFNASLALEYALAADVLFADQLDGEPLTLAHGAPWRIVAPAHYAYKSVKHVQAIELHGRYPSPFHGGGGFVAHRDALVEREQRGMLLPGPVYRRVYALTRPAGMWAARALRRRRG